MRQPAECLPAHLGVSPHPGLPLVAKAKPRSGWLVRLQDAYLLTSAAGLFTARLQQGETTQAAATIATAVRSAYWVWREDRDRAWVPSEARSNRQPGECTWRVRPDEAAKLEPSSATIGGTRHSNIARLLAEYDAIASTGRADRYAALLARCGLSEPQLDDSDGRIPTVPCLRRSVRLSCTDLISHRCSPLWSAAAASAMRRTSRRCSTTASTGGSPHPASRALPAATPLSDSPRMLSV